MSERRRKPGPGGRGGGLRDDGAVRGGRESSSHSPLIKSPYFSTTKVRRRPRSAAAAAAWIPPRSPFRLIQEDLFYDPWKVLLAAIFLNKTRACQAVPNLLRFLERWPDAPSVLDSTESLISEHLRPLGLHHLRARLILQFTEEYQKGDWNEASDLPGIGKYGNDSYKIFCLGQWRSVQPEDHILTLYHSWLLDNDHH